MKFSSFLLLIFLGLSLSCSNDPTRISQKDMIERDVFVDMLVDMHILDAISNESEFYRKFSTKDSLDLYSKIFEKYNVTKAEFDSTVSAYTRRGDLYKEVYDQVLLEINLRIDEANKIEEEEKELDITDKAFKKGM